MQSLAHGKITGTGADNIDNEFHVFTEVNGMGLLGAVFMVKDENHADELVKFVPS